VSRVVRSCGDDKRNIEEARIHIILPCVLMGMQPMRCAGVMMMRTDTAIHIQSCSKPCTANGVWEIVRYLPTVNCNSQPAKSLLLVAEAEQSSNG
jgi:hypothetical protein